MGGSKHGDAVPVFQESVPPGEVGSERGVQADEGLVTPIPFKKCKHPVEKGSARALRSRAEAEREHRVNKEAIELHAEEEANLRVDLYYPVCTLDVHLGEKGPTTTSHDRPRQQRCTTGSRVGGVGGCHH